MTRQIGPYRRATILANPAARHARRFDSAGALRYLQRRGVEARLEVPGSPLGATRAAEAAAARGDDLLFVVGGDGSLRDAAPGVAHSGTALAPVPAGTANVIAHEVGLPRGTRRAIDAHLAGQVVPFDLCWAGKQPFLMMASFGWDAEIVATVSRTLKGRLGQVAYASAALRRLAFLRTRRMRWSSGLAHWEAPVAILVASNTRLYGGLVEITASARANDGQLDFVALCPRRPGAGLVLLGRLLAGRLDGVGQVLSGRVSDLEVETPGIPYQLDGDFAGESPVTLQVEPRALRLSVPGGELPPSLRFAG